MSTVDSIGGSRTTSTNAGKGFSELSSEEFTKIVLTELQNQDPLAPNDTNALLTQLSTIRNIQSSTDLTNSLKKLVSGDEFASAAGLMGKTVGGLDTSNQRVTGVVKSVSRTSEGTVLTLESDKRLYMNNLDSINQTPAPAAG